MDSLAYIAPWVLGSVCIGLVAGFFAARTRGKPSDDELALQRERQTTLKMLVDLLGAAERISTNVESHNCELRENAQQVHNLQVSGEMEMVRMALLHHMTTLLTSNKHLQDDMLCMRYRLEEQAQEIDHARREARTDELTSVANRKAFNEKLHLLLDAWRRDHRPFALILIDLDKFKWVNDAHGHQAGDRVLQNVGEWLRQWVREGDFVGRYGGDEFAVLLPQTELDAARKLAETIRSRTAEEAYRVAVRGGQVAVSLSVGVAVPAPNDDDDMLLQRADEALFRAKRAGRNCVQCQAPASEPAAEPAAAPPPEPALCEVAS